MSPTPDPSTTDRSPPTLVARAPGFLVKKTRRFLVRRYYAWYFERNPDHPALSADRARSAAADADRILFLCWGNICRSPMAERYLQARLADRCVERVTPCSAGWGEYPDRPSPPDAVESARGHGVDLADHRARLLSADLVEDVDVAFVMDYNDYHALTTRYPGRAGDTYFLRPLADRVAETPRIPDPHGRGPERFDEAYATIARALDALAVAIDEEGGEAMHGGDTTQ